MSWRTRPLWVKLGLGSGNDAGTFETTIDGFEWTGHFGSLAQDQARQAWRKDQILAALAARFPNEKLTLVSVTPIAGRTRRAWDRPI
jgi:hypothetical protein